MFQILLVKIMLCSKLHHQKYFKLKHIYHEIQEAVARWDEMGTVERLQRVATHSLTHPLTHSDLLVLLSLSLSVSLSLTLAQTHTHTLTHPLTHSLTNSLTH